jgi:hypothetical protein
LILRIYLIFIFFNNWMYSLTDVSYEILLLGWQSMWFWFSLIDIKFELKFLIIVFRHGLVQGPGSGFWSGHWVTRVNFFLNQNDVILVKKQKSTSCNRVFDRILPGHTGFFLSLFFLQPGPVLAPGRPARPNRVSKLYF